MAEETIKRGDFRVFSCQLSLFYNILTTQVSRILREVLDNFGDAFDGDPLSMPIPQDAPPDIPRVVLTNKTPRTKLEICLSRINFYQFKIDDSDNIDIGEFYKTYSDLCFKLAELLNAPPNRLGAFLVRRAEPDNPGILLARHFCQDKWKEKPLNRPEFFELHAHKKFNIYNNDNESSSLIVNSWVRNKADVRKTGDMQIPVIVVEQDLNTLDEQRQNFGKEAVEKYYSVVPEKMREIFKLYYPEE